jgi:hypothetical protein
VLEAMRCVVAVLLACLLGLALSETHEKHARKHHHGHHHGKHHHGKHHHKHHHSKEAEKPVHEAKTADNVKAPKTAASVAAQAKLAKAAPMTAKPAPVKEDAIVKKMKALEDKLSKRKAMKQAMKQGEILVNGPLPKDFKERFAQAVAVATKTDKQQVKVTDTKASGSDGIMKVSFMASPKVVESVETEAADPDSKLANGNLHSFLVSKGDDDEEPEKGAKGGEEPKKAPKEIHAVAPVEEKGIDIDTAMPYGDLEPFGREDTGQELTEDSISESNAMVDQLERAEVAEEKRSVFRALTRLRGAAITSFDGVARSQTGNIDEYNKIHQWRKTHPLHHLADEESDVSKWAFPDNADF